MAHFGGSIGHIPGRTTGLVGWVLVLGSIGAMVFGIAAQWEPGAGTQVEEGTSAAIDRGHAGGQFEARAFSPGGKSLASVTVTGRLWLTSLASGRSFDLHQGPIGSERALAFSPDGKILAMAGCGPDIRFWDAETGTELDPLDTGRDQARCVAFSPDGSMLATGEVPLGNVAGDAVLGDRAECHVAADVILWDRAERRKVAVLDGLTGCINALAFSPDGSMLAAGDRAGRIRLWDVATTRARATFQTGHQGIGGVVALTFSPKGDLLASQGNLDNTVQLWDTASGVPQGRLRSSSGFIYSVAFSHDGTLAATVQEGHTVALWGIAERREVGTIQGPAGTLSAAVFSDDGRFLLSGGRDATVRRWDLSQVLEGAPPRGH